MKYRLAITMIFLPAVITAVGCGDSVLPEEEEPAGVIRLFGDVSLEGSTRLRFRIDVGDGEEPHLFSYVGGEGSHGYLPADGNYEVGHLDLGTDSVHFTLSSDSRRSISFSARNSANLYIGVTWPAGSREDSTFSWEGGGCRRVAGSGSSPSLSPDVEFAYPVRYELPEYPDSLIRDGIEGFVRVQLRVGWCGSPLEATLTHPLHDLLDQQVLDAVMAWDYYPPRLFRTYVVAEQPLSVIFEIADDSSGTVSYTVGF